MFRKVRIWLVGLSLVLMAAALSTSVLYVRGRTYRDISAHPERFAGKTVVVEGTVERRYGLNSFSIGEWAIGSVLVLAEGRDAMVRERQEVEVTGTVVAFDSLEIEKRWKIPLSNAQDLTRWRGKGSIIASRVRTLKD